MQHDILQIKGCRSIVIYLCNSLDGRTKHIHNIYLHCILLYIRIYLSTRTRCNIAYKVTSSICRIRQRQSCIQARQANGQAWAAYYFHCHFGLIHCSCERDRTGSVDSTDELVQIFSKLRLTCLQTKSHDYGQSMPIGVIATAAIHRLVEFNAAWFGCETKLGRGSFGSGPDTPANQTTDD